MPTRAKQRAERDEYGRRPTTAEQIAGASPASFLGQIIKDVVDCCDNLLGKIKQDTGKGANVSRILAELFMWAWVKKYAEGKYKKLMAEAIAEGVIENGDTLKPGNHIIGESRYFIAQANVTEPVKRFNPEALATWANEKYKIPVIQMKDAIEKAKIASESTVRITITERGI